MSLEFDKCFKSGKISEFSPGKRLFAKELRIAADDLLSAQNSFKDENYKWSIIQAYYSMFHSARALLYVKGYREKSHYCLIESIRSLYVEKRLLDNDLVDALLDAKNLREDADYYGDFSEDNARRLVERADEFLEKANELVVK